ncbi:MAG: hypothetical protein Unbinned3138contig1001_48 [Prokaryotic dsDNA virus sp.]|nr:MAG: hypothetical protein Unbinned3138contig1001_48 [Prokaryotic dsDNA virus sp.]
MNPSLIHNIIDAPSGRRDRAAYFRALRDQSTGVEYELYHALLLLFTGDDE